MPFSRTYFWLFRAVGTLLVGLTLSGGAGAADFPVSTVAEINTALASAAPGDTITMTNKVWTDADILFKKNGTEASPITLRAQTPGQVILNGASHLRISGSWMVVDGLRFQSGYVPDASGEIIAFRESTSLLATNCALINCAIIDYRGTWSNDCKWVSLYGRSNRVENCYFAGKTNLGTTLVVWPTSASSNYPNYHIIRRNHFGLRPALGVNGGETIRVGTSDVSFTSSRTLVEENLFRFCNGETEIISSKSCDNLYRYNTFDSCEGTLTLRHGNRCTVEGNWFFGRGLPLTGGVRIIGEDHTVFNNYFDKLTGSDIRAALCMMNGITNSPLNGYFQVKRAQVLFNTFVNCTNNFAIGAVNDSTLPPIDCTNANNIVRGFTPNLVKIVTTPTNFLWQGNYFSGATVGITNAGIITNNPLMVLNSDGLWRPATNSPVLGAAAGGYTFVTNDFDGQPRSGAKDVGCDQASTSPRTHGPLGPMDVGPNWMRITLTGGPSNQTATVGDNVSFTVAADGTPPFSYRWQKGGTNLANGGNVSGATTNILTLTGVSLSDAAGYRVIVTNTYGSVTSAVATLTVVIPTYTLTVNSGAGSGLYTNGQQVAITADVLSGKTFAAWTGDTQVVASVSSSNTTVTMPAQAVALTATYVDVYVLTVNSGTGDGSYTNGAQVAISADAPEEGQIFDQWIGDTQYVNNVNYTNATVTMPANAVTVRATYKAIAVYHLLTASAGSNGTISPTNANVPAGSSTNFLITASNYYRIATLKTNNADVTGMLFDNNSTTTNFIWSNVQTSGVLAATFTAQVVTNAADTPYWWLAQYGLTNYNTDAVADPDFDGLLTWQEYIAGTNPTNAASVLKAAQNTRDTIIWNAVSGRVYSVYWSTNLEQGFQSLETNIFYPTNNYTNATLDSRVNHYQIKVRMQ